MNDMHTLLHSIWNCKKNQPALASEVFYREKQFFLIYEQEGKIKVGNFRQKDFC